MKGSNLRPNSFIEEMGIRERKNRIAQNCNEKKQKVNSIVMVKGPKW